MSIEQRAKIIVTDQLQKPDEWFTQEIIARGNHIIIKLNGKTTVDFVDEKKYLHQRVPRFTITRRIRKPV